MIYSKRKYNNNIRTNIKNSLNPSLTSIKEANYYSKIENIYKYTYEDYFPKILTFKTKLLLQNEIEKIASNYLHNNFTDQELGTSLTKITIKKIKAELNNKISKDYSFLTESLNNLKNQKINYLSHFRKHCNKTENIASHLCDNGKIGKFIEIKSKLSYKKNSDYVICENCNYCYEKNFIKMFCKGCDKNYYSEILKDNEDINCLPATWDNYHCGTKIKEIMRCLKCKNMLYININNGKLICKNKKCNFCYGPENIIWKCSLCGKEFKSGAKIYNPLDYETINKAINRALLYKIKAKPPFLPCCKGEINDKIIFNHKKDCKGQLYKYNMDNKDIAVCERCHSLNEFDKFTWLCPLCNQTFNLNEKKKVHDYSKSSVLSSNIVNLKKLINSNPNSNRIRNVSNEKIFEIKNNIRNNLSNQNSNKNIFNSRISTPASIDSNKYNFRYYIKNNNINSSPNISYDRGRNSQNVSADLSFIYNHNKSSFNNINKGKEKEDNMNESKSFGKTDYNFYKVNIRKGDALKGIINSRGNNPNLITNNNINKISVELKNILKNNNISNERKNNSISNYRNNNISYERINNNLNNVRKNNNISYERKNNNISYERKNNNISYERNNNNISYERKNNNISFERKYNNNNNNRSSIGNIQPNKVIRNENIGKNLYNSESDSKNKAISYFHKVNIINNNNENNKKKNNEKNNNNIFEIKRLFFERVNVNENRDNISNSKRNNNIHYISDIRNKKIIQNSSDINIDNNQSKINHYNYYNINNIKNINNINIINSTEIKNDKIEKNIFKRKNFLEPNSKIIHDSSFYNHNKSSINNLVFKNYLFPPNDKKDKNKVKKESNENVFNKTSENFRIKGILKNKFSKDIKSSVSSDFLVNKFARRKYRRATKKKVTINEKSLKIYKKSDGKIEIKKDNIEKKNNFNQINPIQDSSEIINSEKIEYLLKNCPIPTFEENDFTYIRSIGEGSYGKIYLVKDKVTKEEFALKKVICKDNQELLKFKNEFELLYSLNNKYIMKTYKLQIKALDSTTSCLYILMECAKYDWNLEIRRRAIGNRFYSEKEIIAILKQLVSGLAFLQRNKIAHRDIKPQNILIYPNNIFKLADLGEAKSVRINKMQMATLRGSELFMSPILYQGLKYKRKNVGHNPYKSDMFSLGLCFLYALCLNIKVLDYIRDLEDMKTIKNTVYKFIDKSNYSEKLMKIIFQMIDLDENKRLDFEQMERQLNIKL